MPPVDRTIRAARQSDVAALAALHSVAFASPWSEPFWAAVLDAPSSLVRIAVDQDATPLGFILARRTADEAEILSLAVDPAYHRQGIATALLRSLETSLRCDLPCRLFLEVSVENAAALALYRHHGFIEVGHRKGYYARPHRAPVDAKVLALDLSL